MKKLSLIITAFLIVFGSVIISSSVTEATPPIFVEGQTIGTVGITATTTYSYINPGTGTTTVGIDTLNAGNSFYGADSALLLVQVVATSTGASATSSLRFQPQYSTDNIDWYSIAQNISTNATTTFTTGAFSELAWPIATSSTSFGALASSTHVNQAFSIPTYTRYVRVLIYQPTTNSGSLAVWSKWVAKKEQAAR